MKKFILLFCLTLATFTTVKAQNETVTNQTILELLKDGFSTEDIIGLIENSSTRTITFGVQYMRELKEAGAESNLIQYLQKISKADYGMEGVLWWNTDSKPKKIYRSQFEKESKSFNLGTLAAAAVVGTVAGSALAGKAPSAGTGAALGAGTVLLASTGKDIQKLVIMGQTSKNVVTTTRPIFRFYLPKHDKDSFSKEADNWYYSIMNEVQSPNEFQLVKMKQKKNRRTFVDGASYSIAGFEGSNAKNRVVVDFEINEINNNTFEIVFNQDLEPGEYVFFWKNGLSSELFKQHVFGFDFSVAGAK
ncbi:MAG: hypothetical protein MJZ12_00730 [Prevotella sp.]|nr:hypothetical protein [Prevotella sp.]